MTTGATNPDPGRAPGTAAGAATARSGDYAGSASSANPAPGAPAPTADGSAPERAWPVREISVKLRDYIARLNRIWVEPA